MTQNNSPWSPRDYAEYFYAKGPDGLGGPDIHMAQCAEYCAVTFDGSRHVYEGAWHINNPDGFRLWAEDVWERGTSRNLTGKWVGNTLKLRDNPID